MDDQTLDHIRQLEESLWRMETRLNIGLMRKTFADDLVEFGSSGKVYNLEEVLAAKLNHSFKATLPLPQFQVRKVATDVVQATYQSEVTYDGVTEFANRSSIWTQADGQWRLRFHQGTAVPL